MGRSNNVNRPYVRKSRNGGASQTRTGVESGAGEAKELLSRAGQAERPSVEQLERRQMLFSLTVSADTVDPNTGLGTARAFFHYYIPYLATSETFTDQPAETVVTSFDQSAYGPIGSGFVFNQEALQFFHNINPASDIAVTAQPQAQDNNNRFVRVNLNDTGEFYALRFFSSQDPNTRQRIAVRTLAMFVGGDPTAIGGDNSGFLTNDMQIELFLNDTVTATFTGQQIVQLFDQDPNNWPPGTNPANGTGNFSVTAPDNAPAFDEIRFTMLRRPSLGVTPSFILDDIAYTKTNNKYAQLMTTRAFGAAVALSGPVGASVTFKDLYGRDMVNNLAGIPGRGADINPGDLDDNGIPERNDGIGSIRFSGTDSRTSFTMVGGTLGTSEDQPDGFNPGTLIPQVWWDGFYTLTLEGDPAGIYDDFEEAGFGFAAEERNTQVIITGMPPGSGSVIVGSPFVRDNTNFASYAPEDFARGANGQDLRTVTTGFTRANQGIFVEDGGSIGSINIAGMLFGASVFNGFVDRLAVGNLMGSVTVAGDLGSLVVGADAGIWSPDPGFAFQDGTQLDQNNKTNALVVVGRTAGQILIGGRSQLDVTVVGDVASPTTRPQRDSSVYYELEAYSGAAPGAGTAVGQSSAHSSVVNNAQVASNLGRTGGQPVVFGSNFLRNDSIMSAEVITSQSGGVRIKGEVSQRDPFNGDDEADVFAFAVNGNETINFQGTITNGANIGANPASLYFRIVDADGVTIAAPDRPTRSDQFVATNMNFKPNAPGVYYVVVMDPTGITETGGGATPYTLAISGLATATLGAYRTGAGQGLTDRASGEGSSVTVLSGNIGSVRLGTGYLVGNAETDPTEISNTVQPADDAMSWQGGSISTPGSIYNITTGSDIGQPGANTTGNTNITVTIGGDLGSLVTGMSPLFGAGQGSGEGDVNFFTLNVGGRIGTIDIRGGVGMDQDSTDPRAPVGPNSLNIFTGLNGSGGDIGFIKVGFHVAGDSMNVTTPGGSTIGALLVSQAAYNDTGDRSGIYLGEQGIRLNTGSGSDVRFADAPRIDLANSVDVVFPLFGGTALDLIDDSGARVQVIIDGPFGQQLGELIALPVDGSQGVVIASINADLTNGRVLRISSSGTSGVVGIGRMVLAGDGTSQIALSGAVEIDVWRIIDSGPGGGFASITNTTPNGDFVSIDVAGLGTLNVDGDLGRTQVPAYGPQLIGPRLGVATTLQGNVGDALGLQPGLFDTSLAANKIYRAIGDSNTDEGQAALDDVGSPIDGDLNGLVVRVGNVQQVRAKGRLGDVILQGNGAVLQNATANYDILSAFGVFEGLVGTVYAANIVRVDVGDGIAKPDPSPMSTTGIFAANNIGDVTSGRRDGTVVISGPISASNSQADNIAGVADGINTIVFTNAQFRGAYIGSQDLDGFWSSFLYGDDNRSRGDIGDVSITGGTFFTSIIRAGDVRTILFTNAFYDASRILATGNLGTVTVQGFRNSTLTGSLDELSINDISVAGDVERITAVGDMNDLVVDVVGRVRGGIFATNISRSAIDVDNQLLTLTATNAIRATSVNVGEVPTVLARDFYASTFTASGVITTFTASNAIVNTRIEVTGPAAGIGTILAANGISGAIASSGPITAITSTTGDINADITTTTSRGNVGTITAGRDLAIRSDVSGNIAGLVAGRNIGTVGETGVILVRGDLASLSIPTGSLYNDIRVGGGITAGITVGGAIVKPDNNQVSNGSIIAFGAIKAVAVTGDFDGDIISHTGGITSVLITNGSFLPGNTIAAYDGSIGSVSIVNGNLYGNVHADFDITLLSVAGAADGIFGDVGVNPTLSAAVRYDDRRNQLPPGVSQKVGIQGPEITAGRNIVKFQVLGGNVYEASVFATRAITSIAITGSISNDTLTTGTGSYFAAGDSITSITVTGTVSNAAFVAGLVDLGDDGVLGGTLLKADTIKSGNIGLVSVGGRVSDSYFAAGMNAGTDGVYNTSDDTTALGISTVTTLTFGSVGSNVSVFGDTLSAAVSADTRFTKGGFNAPHSNSLINTAASLPISGGVSFTAGTRTFNLTGGGTVTVTLVGPGTANFEASTSTLRLLNTTSASSVSVSASAGTLASFDILGTDDSSLATLAVSATLTGDSDIAIDGGVTTLTLARVEGTGNIYVGGDITTLTVAAFVGGFMELRSVTTLTINGQFGATNSLVSGEAIIHALSTGAISITGAARGLLSVDRDTTSLSTGLVERSLFRFGNSVGAITAPSFRATIVSAGDSIGAVAVTGDMIDTALVSGVDLGVDAFYGGTRANADVLSTGTIGAVTVGGNFNESDITAGYYRGNDGFVGTSDDTVSAGRGSIASVTIGGSSVGSTRSTESYRIASNGTLGPIRIGGLAFNGTRGNFSSEAPLLTPNPARVNEIIPTVNSRIFSASIVFNQPIDFATLSPSLSVSEVRGDGDVEIRLIEGVDYTLSYNNSTNTANVTFSRAISERNLPTVPDRPGPGVYRFTIDDSLFRARLIGTGLDGDSDGFATNGDDFSQDAVVGDAGDKITSAVTQVPKLVNGQNTQYRVDLYGATNLNFVLDNNRTADNLPDVNATYTLRGFIGDHPDNDTSVFRFAGDVDVYSITLQAGQILRLGKMQGTAPLAQFDLYNAALTAQPQVGGITASVNTLPPPAALTTDVTFARTYLIQQTGTYYLVVGNAGTLDDASVQNPDQFPLQVGDYNFTINVFDDGDSGFTSTTNAGDGSAVVNAPAASDFAGLDGILGTSDDVKSIVTNGFSFTRNATTGLISGNNGNGIVSTRDSNNRLVSTIDAAIGPAGHAGVPNSIIASDVDVFHLNNRQAIAAGTKLRVTIKLTQFGADLGSASPQTFSDNRGSVQFGIFDTTASVAIDDASLVFSASDFLPYGGTPNTTIADNGTNKYGYDANGDFFAEFIVPERQGSIGQAGTFAAYLQGVYNTDYQIEVVTDGSGTYTAQTQNVFIETNGGEINWLQVGGVTSELGAFNLKTLGYTGTIGNLSVEDYFTSNLVASLNTLYQGAGYDVRFSTNSADFEFQPFSTVYLSGTADPVFALYNSFAGSFNFDILSAAFRSSQPYGFSQHVDPFNTDLEDDAAVFVPTFAIQGFGPGQTGLDSLTQSVTGAIARRVGELVGLRVTVDNGDAATSFDPMASDSPESLPGSGRAYSLSNARRRLSTGFDTISNTNFYLGNQNAVSLLDQVLARR